MSVQSRQPTLRNNTQPQRQLNSNQVRQQFLSFQKQTTRKCIAQELNAIDDSELDDQNDYENNYEYQDNYHIGATSLNYNDYTYQPTTDFPENNYTIENEIEQDEQNQMMHTITRNENQNFTLGPQNNRQK